MRALPDSQRALARRLGISPSTVSRALRDDPRISLATRNRVKQAAGRLRQAVPFAQPSAGAPAPGEPPDLATAPLGMVIANPTGGLRGDQFFRDVTEAALAYVARTGRQLMLEAVSGRSGAPLPKLVEQRVVAGVLVGGVPIDDEWLDRLTAGPVPVVTIGKYTARFQQYFAAIPDNVAGGYLAGQHLVECGYDEWWFVGGDLAIQTFADRLAGMRRALGGRRVEVVIGGIDEEAGLQAAAVLAESAHRGARPGVFAATDWLASGLARGLRQQGVHVPEAVGVVGYSDLELASHTTPRLTTIRVNRQQLAWLACRLLEDRIAGVLTHPVQAFIQPELVVRESTQRKGQPDAEE